MNVHVQVLVIAACLLKIMQHRNIDTSANTHHVLEHVSKRAHSTEREHHRLEGVPQRQLLPGMTHTLHTHTHTYTQYTHDDTWFISGEGQPLFPEHYKVSQFNGG